MKKYFIFSIFVGFLFLGNFNFLQASSYNPGFGTKQPCNQYWWPELEWEGPNYTIIEIDGCWYTAAYFTRQTTAGRVEFQITEFIRLLSSTCTTTHSFDRIKREIYVKLFDNPAFDNDSLVPMAIQESSCRREEPYIPDPHGTELSPYSVDTLFTVLPDTAFNYSDSLELSAVIPPPTNGFYTLLLDQYFVFCQDTVCCRAYYNTYYDINHKLKAVHYESLSRQSYLGGDTCSGEYCTENCSSLIWNWDSDSTGGFYKLTGKISKGNEKELSLYPNPVSKELNIELNNNQTGILSFTIYDLNGIEIINEIYSKNERPFKITLNLSNIVKGNYFIDLKINNLIYNRKFQVK